MPAEIPPGWTDERVAYLRQAWANGLTCAQIAKQLGGVSRNAVIGKVRRLDLERRSPEAANAAARINTRARAARPPRPAKPKPVAPAGYIIAGGGAVIERNPGFKPGRPAREDAWKPLPGSEPRPFVDRPSKGCRWPVEVAGENLACCAPRIDDRYCSAHAELSGSAGTPATANELMRALRRHVA